MVSVEGSSKGGSDAVGLFSQSGPNAQDSSKQFVENMENLSQKLDSEIRDFSSESSSESVRSKTPVSMERSKRLDEDEAVIAICMGNLPYVGSDE
ncbi:hypothetical protein V6N12_020688 [Hibiscus sabdariffa]|uniref:Uncharacterized protein n=1 Tax=Hibiscus sabdariffa TaxID=183260 RepID=A0ABR2CYT6_9ROSI